MIARAGRAREGTRWSRPREVWLGKPAAERAGIEGDPVLAGLQTVTDGRVVFAEGSDYDALQFASALSLPCLLENFVPKLSRALS
ncbi:hypothetical protein [Modestobacter sp. SYSU DS0290]